MESSSPRGPDLRLRSCTECRRRKQKCKPGSDPEGPCANCTKRYPPVECIKSKLDARLKPNRRPYNVNYQVQVVINNENTTSFQPLERPRQFGGTVADVNTANISPIDRDAPNAELFYFYLQRLCPLMASLDGQNMPSIYHNAILPLMMQSPLLPKISILEAASFQEIFRRPDLAETRRMIHLKGDILSQINSYLRDDFNKTYQEAIQSVIHLIILEYYWGEFAGVMAHMNGLKAMVRLRGGIQALHNTLVTQLIILLDFEVACRYEQVLYIITPEDTSAITATACPEGFESPLSPTGAPFSAVLEYFFLPYELSSLLDDVRLLTSKIAGLLVIKPDPDSPQQQNSTSIPDHAHRLHTAAQNIPSIAISPSSPPADLIHSILHTTTIIYSTALSTRTPLSTVLTHRGTALRQQLYSEIFRVSLSDWKQIPGLFLWVLLVASIGSGKDALGRLLRTNETLAAIYCGLRDFGFCVDCLKRFLGVQRWIRERAGEP